MSKPVIPTIQIRSGIPMPPRRWIKKSVPITLSRMQIGDYFDIPFLRKGYYTVQNVHKAALTVKVKVSVRTYVNGEDSVTTDAVPEGKQFIRVWRTE
jgi:hypothetical protein